MMSQGCNVAISLLKGRLPNCTCRYRSKGPLHCNQHAISLVTFGGQGNEIAAYLEAGTKVWGRGK